MDARPRLVSEKMLLVAQHNGQWYVPWGGRFRALFFFTSRKAFDAFLAASGMRGTPLGAGLGLTPVDGWEPLLELLKREKANGFTQISVDAWPVKVDGSGFSIKGFAKIDAIIATVQDVIEGKHDQTPGLN